MNLHNYLIKEIFKFEEYTQYYLTLDLNSINSFEDASKIYEMLNQYIKKNEIQIIYEKVFGKLKFKNKFIQLRNKNREPITFIDGNPINDVPISSIIICGIANKSNNVNVTYIKNLKNNDIIGTEIKSKCFDYLYLSEIKSKDKYIFEIYDSLEKYLKLCNFTVKDIVRTWIYLDNIYSNYEQLNTVRRNFFKCHDIDFDSNAKRLPSSTCISGKSQENYIATMDVQCIHENTDNSKINRIYNKYQNEAEGDTYMFRPTFSRGIFVEDNRHVEIQLSGTASVNELGQTIHLNNPYNQIKKSLLNVLAILEQFDMNLSNLCQSTCFFKRKEYYKEYLNVIKDLNIENFCSTYVVADVCREDLLFELDGIAIKIK